MIATCRGDDLAKRALVLALIAAAAGSVFAANLSGADVRHRATPGLLPAEVREAARPMDSAPSGGSEGDLPTSPTTADELSRAVADLDAGRWERAISWWTQASLPPDSEVWRQLTLGSAYLYVDQPDAAEQSLALALERQPRNAAVHYFLGMLKMEQAAAAAAPPITVRRVSSRVTQQGRSKAEVAPSQSGFELAAINEFERAIALSADMPYDDPLLPSSCVIQVPYPASDLVPPPTVGELLYALGADNFVGKAHGMLAYLCLDHERTDDAELHVDKALACGIPVPRGYRLVGQQYEQQGRHTDAFRAFLKAMKQGDGLVRPGSKAFDNLHKALNDLF